MNPTKKISKAIPGSGGEAELEAEKEKTELFKLLEAAKKAMAQVAEELEAETAETASPESEGVDGTYPAIIVQVSELLNYVYGKTSVVGQIDRVSNIMRAYEGREAVLLELLKKKALIKANADTNRRDHLLEALEKNMGKMKKCTLQLRELGADDESLEIIERNMGEMKKLFTLQLQQEAGEVSGSGGVEAGGGSGGRSRCGRR